MKWSFLLILLILITSARAEECKTMNLVTEKNSPFSKIPVMDQNGSNTCYAFAATQLINYYEMKNGAKDQVLNVAWAALSSAKRGGGINALWSSSPEFVIWGLGNHGNCSKGYIETSLRKWMRLANATEAQFLAMIDGLTGNISQMKDKNLSEKELKSIFYKSMEVIPSCTPDNLWKEIAPHLMSLSVINSDQILREIVFPDCKKAPIDLHLPSPQVSLAPLYRMTAPRDLSNLLDSTHNPVAISYCSHMLYDHNYQGILPPVKGNSVPLKKDCGNHASLIVGKKKIGGACHFLLRNSWGSGFNKSNKDLNCLCRNKKTGEYVDDCHMSTHNNGLYTVDSCWIPQKMIPLNVFKYISIK